MSMLRETIQQGWPDQIVEVPECIRPYYSF